MRARVAAPSAPLVASRPMGTLRTFRAVKSWLTHKAATTEYETLLDRGDRQVPASVIVPRGTNRRLPGWIVLHGITRPGRFHPNLLRFVRALASSGLAVLVPQVPEWRDLRLAPEVTLPTLRGALEGLRPWTPPTTVHTESSASPSEPPR